VVSSDYICGPQPTYLFDPGFSRSSKLMRWALALREYDLQFKYKDDKNYARVDRLSRM